jgi:hypothetical protein
MSRLCMWDICSSYSLERLLGGVALYFEATVLLVPWCMNISAQTLDNLTPHATCATRRATVALDWQPRVLALQGVQLCPQLQFGPTHSMAEVVLALCAGSPSLPTQCSGAWQWTRGEAACLSLELNSSASCSALLLLMHPSGTSVLSTPCTHVCGAHNQGCMPLTVVTS